MEALSSQDDLARPSGTESRISVFEELPEEAFTVQQTLSFVSPRAFGDNARRVKGVLDDHEERIVLLEALEGKVMVALDRMLKQRMAELSEEILRPFMDRIQNQMDDFMANARAQMSELASKMESFTERAEAALQAAKDQLASTSERMTALEKRVEELSNALDANGEADRKLQEALKRVAAEADAFEAMREQLLAGLEDHASVQDLKDRLQTAEERLSDTIQGLETAAADASNALALGSRLELSLEEVSQRVVVAQQGADSANAGVAKTSSSLAAAEEARQEQVEEDAAQHRAHREAMATAEAAAVALKTKVDALSAQIKVDLTASLASLQHDVAHLAADHHHHDHDDDVRLQRLTEHHGDEEKAAAAAAPAAPAPVLAAVPEEPAKPVKSKAAVAAAAVLATVAAPAPAPVPAPSSPKSSATSKWAGLRGSVKAGIALHQTRAAVVPKLAMSKDCSAQVNDHEKLLRALVRKANSQGRCLQALVADSIARRAAEAAARAKQPEGQGIAVQCLSCARRPGSADPRNQSITGINGVHGANTHGASNYGRSVGGHSSSGNGYGNSNGGALILSDANYANYGDAGGSNGNGFGGSFRGPSDRPQSPGPLRQSQARNRPMSGSNNSSSSSRRSLVEHQKLHGLLPNVQVDLPSLDGGILGGAGGLGNGSGAGGPSGNGAIPSSGSGNLLFLGGNDKGSGGHSVNGTSAGNGNGGDSLTGGPNQQQQTPASTPSLPGLLHQPSPAGAMAQAKTAALFLGGGGGDGSYSGLKTSTHYVLEESAGYVQGSNGGDPGGVDVSGFSQRFLPRSHSPGQGGDNNDDENSNNNLENEAAAEATAEWERMGLESGPGPSGAAIGPEDTALWERMAAAAEPRDRKHRHR